MLSVEGQTVNIAARTSPFTSVQVMQLQQFALGFNAYLFFVFSQKYFCTPYLHYSSTLPKALFSRTASLLSRLIATCHNRVACIAIHQSQAGSHPHFSIAANDRLQRHHPSTHQQSDAPKSMVCARRIGMAAHGPVGTLVGRNMVETCKPMPSKCLIIDVGKVRS